jgi:endonuclease/exonuclease/phosphatase family metal-dependent hydrolase
MAPAESSWARNLWVQARAHALAPLAFAALLLVLIGALLYPSQRTGHQAQAARAKYVLVQMNLCLSGLAGCFPGVDYPRGVHEARARIEGSHADAVTLNEVCQGDVEDLARSTGYHLRFAAVTHGDQPLPCREPGGRGVFGIAVLTKAPITSSSGDAYAVQDDVEQRHWLCARTDDGVTVCTTHLDIRGSEGTDAVNDAQCAEFTRVLQSLESAGPLIAAGDMNRWESCAPTGMWTRGDDRASQRAGVQHVYGDAQFRRPARNVRQMTYTDHDALVVASELSR